jgi:hypothetical protein
VPIAPVVIRGTRRVLRGGTIVPTWGRIEVEALQPLDAVIGAGDSAAHLREEARARIAESIGEPLL